jgi:hypothetical protein
MHAIAYSRCSELLWFERDPDDACTYTQESRTKKVAELMATLHSSSLVLGMDPRETNSVVHGGVQTQASGISDSAISGLAGGIERLREIKRSRMEKVCVDVV